MRPEENLPCNHERPVCLLSKRSAKNELRKSDVGFAQALSKEVIEIEKSNPIP